MGEPRLPRRQPSRADSATWVREQGKADVDRLLEENAQLRELVIELTKLAIKNIVTPPRRVD